MPKVIFNNKSRAFFDSLKADVDHYFQEKKIHKTGNAELYAKAAVLIIIAVSVYLSLLFLQMPPVVAILLCTFLGFVLASIGFNVMHDACHGSFSEKKWVNEFFGLSLNALGGNAFLWKFKHNILHHSYPNIDGMDDDIAKSPLMRQAPTQKWVPAHKFQHIYVVLVYALASFAWVFIMDFNKYFKQKVYTSEIHKISLKEHIIFWTSKVLYALFYILIPVYFVGWNAWMWGFICMHLSMGLTLALTFQLAHVVEEAEFQVAGLETKHIESEWAVHQVKSTSNFAPKNIFLNWFVGGLNFQIEHHLFPRIIHVHYRHISPIVRKHCVENGLPYNQHNTMSEAIVSHFRLMKHFGSKP